MGPHAIPCYFHLESSCLDLDLNTVLDQLNYPNTCIIIIIINRRSGNTSHTSHGHKTGTRSMQPVRSVPLGGPIVIPEYLHGQLNYPKGVHDPLNHLDGAGQGFCLHHHLYPALYLGPPCPQGTTQRCGLSMVSGLSKQPTPRLHTQRWRHVSPHRACLGLLAQDA